MVKILYSSDLHGNEVQYEKVISRAIDTKADIVIIGGDIAPKSRPYETFIERQRAFLSKKLPLMFKRLKLRLPNTKVFLMMGNDDCSANEKLLDQPGLYTNINAKRIKINDEYSLIGYSYIPITPFSVKDWEKYDLSGPSSKDKGKYKERKAMNYFLKGMKSTAKGFVDFSFKELEESHDSIQKDLAKSEYLKKPESTVYVMHCPPNETNLDQLAKGIHIGSFAIKEFIEKVQPYLTLHGHIHEAFDISGEYRQTIGKTVSALPGNSNLGEEVHVLEFEIEDLSTMKRVNL